MVFAAESFPLETGRKLTALILDAQGTGDLKMAQTNPESDLNEPGLRPVSADLARLMAECGTMKAAADAAERAATSLPQSQLLRQ
jgi:hypothetical protein